MHLKKGVLDWNKKVTQKCKSCSSFKRPPGQISVLRYCLVGGGVAEYGSFFWG